jgi:very-short-patch-repair endonuclease
VLKKKLPYQDQLRTRVLSLRRGATPGEKKLWAALRENRKIINLKFRRQQPVGPYIADFYCHEHKLVVELDGMSHETKLASDRQRDAYMEKQGLRVLRFSEKEACDNPSAIIETVLAEIGFLPQPLPEGGA